MKRLMILAACCLLLTGCFLNEPMPTAAPPAPPSETLPAPTAAPTETQINPTESEAPETVPATIPETEPPTEPETEPQTFVFTVYTGNDNADGFVAPEVEVDAISETVVMEKLIEAGVLTAETVLNSFEIADNTVYLDFNGAFQDLLFTQGTAGERMLMGSVVNTFLSAYDAESVMITVNGEVLESGHVIYDFPLEFFE